jgi:hypothetical protein
MSIILSRLWAVEFNGMFFPIKLFFIMSLIYICSYFTFLMCICHY